ncbi:L-lactate dehydrogenase A chain-like isoform X2 [Photinus pyralis]|uniref:L-lactate dehydrogenase A chain-like isoform X2 n=1 Tax=Photinus pyralis TaxID=7054 RepID=UPI001267483B|nr:L-lactate dehydrogenase A chain-like isoform X2 [Photinus pyralis]
MSLANKFLSILTRRYRLKKSYCSSNRCSSSTKDQILHHLSNPAECHRSKVSIIGVGNVGIAVANITNDIAIVSLNEQKLKGEVLDLQHASQFLYDPSVVGGTDLKITQNSYVTIIAASDKDVKPLDMIRNISADVIKHSPHTFLIIVSDPVNVLTQECAKTLGVPKNRIIGTGCHVDSVRLRHLISQKYGVAPESCSGWVLGDHGDCSVIAWSTLSVGGTRISSTDQWPGLHEEIIKVTKYDGKSTSTWTIALSISDMVKSILQNTRKVFSVSVPVKGFYGIMDDVYLSLPSVLGANGVSEIVQLPLTDTEIEALQRAACHMKTLQQELTC